MRLWILKVTLVFVCVGAVRGGYDYVIEGGYGLPNLNDSQTLLMTGGGGADFMGPQLCQDRGNVSAETGFWRHLDVGHAGLF